MTARRHIGVNAEDVSPWIPWETPSLPPRRDTEGYGAERSGTGGRGRAQRGLSQAEDADTEVILGEETGQLLRGDLRSGDSERLPSRSTAGADQKDLPPEPIPDLVPVQRLSRPPHPGAALPFGERQVLTWGDLRAPSPFRFQTSTRQLTSAAAVQSVFEVPGCSMCFDGTRWHPWGEDAGHTRRAGRAEAVCSCVVHGGHWERQAARQRGAVGLVWGHRLDPTQGQGHCPANLAALQIVQETGTPPQLLVQRTFCVVSAARLALRTRASAGGSVNVEFTGTQT
ncbi:uncharacterized protein LOC119236926 [Talpa occidentalis]|uniref:uncharacterized protein LOC119236926 n=1 Tax=Talpa occidentalis TaxID=50954 RepID=UPI00189051B3|nr:uncharacterized protein LOC119236926 [Talpa occidentalis]